MQKILITGAAGFLGGHLTEHFASRGFTVGGLDAAPERCAPLDVLECYYQRDLPSNDLEQIIEDFAPDFCIHAAGSASVPASFEDPAADFQAGPVLTWHLLDALRRGAPACKTLFLSSAAVYGSPRELPVTEDTELAPISPYGFHKLLSCQVCREFAVLHGTKVAIARIFSAYGPGLRKQVVWDLCRQALTNGAISAQGTGAESRDFIHVADVCRAAEAVLRDGDMCAGIYNFASGDETKISELAATICSVAGSGCTVTFDGKVPEGTPLNWRADISRLQALGFSTSVSVEDGVRETVEWCRGQMGNGGQ